MIRGWLRDVHNHAMILWDVWCDAGNDQAPKQCGNACHSVRADSEAGHKHLFSGRCPVCGQFMQLFRLRTHDESGSYLHQYHCMGSGNDGGREHVVSIEVLPDAQK